MRLLWLPKQQVMKFFWIYCCRLFEPPTSSSSYFYFWFLFGGLVFPSSITFKPFSILPLTGWYVLLYFISQVCLLLRKTWKVFYQDIFLSQIMAALDLPTDRNEEVTIQQVQWVAMLINMVSLKLRSLLVLLMLKILCSCEMSWENSNVIRSFSTYFINVVTWRVNFKT